MNRKGETRASAPTDSARTPSERSASPWGCGCSPASIALRQRPRASRAGADDGPAPPGNLERLQTEVERVLERPLLRRCACDPVRALSLRGSTGKLIGLYQRGAEPMRLSRSRWAVGIQCR